MGLGYYADTQKIWDLDNPQNYIFGIIKKSIEPQVGLAAQYMVTPLFSLRGNYATFLSTKGTALFERDIINETDDVTLKLSRWQVEGKFLVKPGLEATVGYRAWDSSLAVDEEEMEISLDSKGFYIGVRYSY